MRLTDLKPETIERMKTYKWDRIIEKHEGPERWESVLKHYDPDFLTVDGYEVLLPIDCTQHPTVTFLRCVPAADGRSLTIFLKDTTYSTPEYETFDAGYLAVCDKFPGEEFYLSVVYHDWFIVQNPA